jgi:hypothetical protein
MLLSIMTESLHTPLCTNEFLYIDHVIGIVAPPKPLKDGLGLADEGSRCALIHCCGIEYGGVEVFCCLGEFN